MKKGLYLLWCFAMGVSVSYADALWSSIDFENRNLWGKYPTFMLDDNGRTRSNDNRYWLYLSELGNDSLIREYDKLGGETPYEGVVPPTMHAAVTNAGLLAVMTESPLLRAVRPASTSSGLLQDDGETIPENGLFLDMQVSLVAQEFLPEPSESVAAGSKLECRLQIVPDADGSATTARRLVITAGSIDADGNLTAAHYMVTNSVEEKKWHRLTARAIANAATQSGATFPAFALYIDGVPVACEAEDYAASIGEGAATCFAGESHFRECALFPSMQPEGGQRHFNRMYALGMQGELKADEIVFTTDDPFMQPGPSVELTLNCNDSMISNLAVVVNSVTNSFLEAPPFSGTTITVRPGDVVTYEPTVYEKYRLDEGLTLIGNKSVVASSQGFTINFINPENGKFADTSPLTATITARNVYFRVGDGEYTTFAEAIDDASQQGGGVIRLITDVRLSTDPRADNGQARIYPKQSAVLDLCGHVITGDHFAKEAAIYDQGVLTIIDSVGGGAIRAAGNAIAVVSSNDVVNVNRSNAELYLGDGDLTKQFSVFGKVLVSNGKLDISAGEYLNPDGAEQKTDKEDFYLKDYVTDSRFDYGPVMMSFESDSGWGFAVTNAGNLRALSFVVPHGVANPSTTNVVYGGTLNLADVSAVSYGYTISGWSDGESVLPLDGTVEVLRKRTYTAIESAALTNRISYSDYVSPNPRKYTVEDAILDLLKPTRPLFTFVGWRDENTGYFVSAIGNGAKFVGTDIPVHGDLDLKARWVSESVSWKNTESGLVESNGTYRGAWPFSLQPSGSTITNGMPIAIEEIDFCIVNPLLYPKTAEYLTITNAAGAKVVSDKFSYSDWITDGEYVLGTNVLRNSRAKVKYRFSNLVITVGAPYGLYLSDAQGNLTGGFLRFVKPIYSNQSLIGTCTEAGGDGEGGFEKSEEYRKFCPAYEIYGHPAEGAANE